jgi:uncharacterized protein with HEPN domain
MLALDDLAKIDDIEQATSAVLTMMEGLEREELARSRVTRHAVRDFLLNATAAVEGLSPEARSAFPELDFFAWRTTRQRLEAGETIESDTGWFAIQALMPTTLGWLRFYRESQPELFLTSS